MMYIGSSCRIFVSIAAYRDKDTPNTVRDLLAKADRPHMVKVGVFSQIDRLLDNDCVVGNTPNVHEIQIEAYKARGVCWARNYIFENMLGSEDFVLQIDSHSRFDKGWDTTLLQMYEELANPNVVITSYPMGFDAMTGVLQEQQHTRFTVRHFDDEGLPRFGSDVICPEDAVKPMKTFAIAGGCMFTRAATVKHVPYDPYLYFNGEEHNYAIRLFTHGYDLVCPHRPFMYHAYGNTQNRPFSWADNRTTADALKAVALERIRHVLDIQKTTNPAALTEIDKYKLGTVRSLMDWEYYSGIHLRSKSLGSKALSGLL